MVEKRGLDHGAWIPLKIMYPAAQVPVVQVSLPTGSFDELVRLGAALRPLREKGVLVMGSGGSVHNLRALRHGGPADDWVIQFEQWLLEAIVGNQFERLITPSGFPAAFPQAHPTLEHYAPLVVAWAAGDPDQPGRRIHHSFTYCNLGMSCFEFGNRIS
jgi:4,5-DOPA dioxygenase extradiol